MASDDESALSSPLSSVPSSPLSELSRSPSPPSDPEAMAHLARLQLLNPYPSPPASQQTSHSGSPTPDGMDATVSSDKDGAPPAKRRRISKERSTEYLDLRSDTIDPDQQPQLDRLLHVLHKHQKVVVVAGAGISVSAGIPDFRSSAGLFRTLKDDYKLKGSGKDLFDASVYKNDASTSSFHDMVTKMSRMTKDAKPTAFHHMLATVAQEDRLLRLYSQNVDGIDTSLAPLKTCIPLRKEADGKWPRTVQLHGGLTKMVCSKCHDLSDLDASLFDGPVPPLCPRCEEINDIRTNHEGKRSHGIGRLRPRMVLYNEHNPDDEAIGAVTREDLRRRPDAIIVVGTTLRVPGVRRIVREMCGVIRDRRGGTAIWINNDPPPPSKDFEDCWDIIVQGPCDAVARHAAMRKWDEPHDSFSELDEAAASQVAERSLYVGLPSRSPWPELAVTHVKLEPLPSTLHVNNSFRPPSPDKAVRTPMEHGPMDWSPMPSRTHPVLSSIEGDADKSGADSLLDDTIGVASGLLTPTKPRRQSPAQKPKVSLNDKLKDAAAKAAKAKAQPKSKGAKPSASTAKAVKKQSNVKYVKPAKPRPTQSKAKAQKMAPGPKSTVLMQTFKHSKAATVSSGKEGKVFPPSPTLTPSKLRQVSNASSLVADPGIMHPLLPQDSRHNLSLAPASPAEEKDLAPYPNPGHGENLTADATKRGRVSVDSLIN